MIVLSTTSDKIEVVLAGAITTSQLPCFASWRDITTTVYTPGSTATATNSTTDVSLVAAPASSTQRVIDFISVYNADTESATVTIKFDDGTERILVKVVLATGERLEYTDDKGFAVYTVAGAVKASQTAAQVSSGLNVVVLGSDVTNNNGVANTIADVTGLSFAVTSGTLYWFRATATYTSAATTTGSRWSVNGPASPTYLAYTGEWSLGATTKTLSNAVAYDNPTTSNATSAKTAGNVAVVEGYIRPSSDGTLVVRFASEVAGSAIVAKTGSILQWMAL